MKTRNVSILMALVLMAAGVVFANEVPAPPAIGSTIEGFSLPDVDGTERSLKSLAGEKGTVLLFIAVQCPVSNAYNERMEKLATDYKAKGINVVGINSNVAEDGAACRLTPTRTS
jgi:peroxiredoxin